MKNANMPARPTNVTQQEYCDVTGDHSVQRYAKSQMGLTKREEIARSNLQGILSNAAYSYDGFAGAAKMAVEAADALLAELEKLEKQK
ncbi:hypothetical protein 13VV501A_gene0009 [Vibrio phage 13VV501A]|nr:hypothetical protein 13VV501A_gene0009 [Vibrio phage 13VV501A]